MRFALFCRRPAVSMMSTSAFASLALALASNATDAGSAPSLSERTTGTPTLAPQVSSWSAAAARERVGRAQHDLLAFGDEQSGQLARGGGFAGAVHTDHDDDARLVRAFLVGVETAVDVGADELQKLVLQRRTHFGRVGLACDAGVVAQFLNELFAGFRAHVGKQEGVFDVLPVGFGELVLGEDVEQGLAERVAGLGQARLEALHAGAGGFGGFDGWGRGFSYG